MAPRTPTTQGRGGAGTETGAAIREGVWCLGVWSLAWGLGLTMTGCGPAASESSSASGGGGAGAAEWF